MAKPKRKPFGWFKGEVDHALVKEYARLEREGKLGKPAPTDTDRLDALLRLFGGRIGRVIAGPAGVFVHSGIWRRIRTRRDIDKLLKEERRAK